MPVVAVINRKGGCGKSTLATTLASWCASEGHQVMIGDIDKQQSIRSWLSARPADCASVLSWAVDNGKVFRAPPGTTHVVLDTPGGLYDYALAKLLVHVNAVVVPVGPSLFDLDASRGLLEELLRHPRVAAGRCQIALVGMRWPHDSGDLHRLERLANRFPLLTVIPEDPLYRQLLDFGRGLFDLSPGESSAHLQDWKPLLGWLERVWQPEGLAGSSRGTSQRAQPPTESASPGRASRAESASSASTTKAPRHPIQSIAEAGAHTLRSGQEISRSASPITNIGSLTSHRLDQKTSDQQSTGSPRSRSVPWRQPSLLKEPTRWIRAMLS